MRVHKIQDARRVRRPCIGLRRPAGSRVREDGRRKKKKKEINKNDSATVRNDATDTGRKTPTTTVDRDDRTGCWITSTDASRVLPNVATANASAIIVPTRRPVYPASGEVYDEPPGKSECGFRALLYVRIGAV